MKLKPLIVSVLLLLSAAALGARTVDVLVIRASYDTTPFTTEINFTDSVLTQANNYLSEQLSPDIDFKFTLSPKEILISNPSTVASQIIEACRLSDESIDFKQFDADQDGSVDAVCVVFAGTQMWPQEYSLTKDSKAASYDGKKIDTYVAVPELFQDTISTISVYAHEFLHVIGLKDLYDSDNQESGGQAEALWNLLSPMDYAAGTALPNLSAVDYDQLGLGIRDTLSLGVNRLTAIQDERRYIYCPTDTHGEYFLLECRSAQGRDSALGRSGLAIYHIDKSQNRSGYSTFYEITLSAYQRWEREEVNCRADHQCADLVEAASEVTGIQDLLFPRAGTQNFGSDTEPAWRYWNGAGSPLALMDITVDASGATFTAIRPLTPTAERLYQDEARISWGIDPYLLPRAQEVLVFLGDSLCARMEQSGEETVSCTFSELSAGTEYSCKAELHCTDGSVFSDVYSFTTNVLDQRNAQPFIYLNDVERAPDGAFSIGTIIPLHVYNLQSGESVQWYFNGEAITVAEYKVTESGKLAAEVHHTDGTTEVIVKEIRITED